jgi:flagellar biosynthesis protein FlhG
VVNLATALAKIGNRILMLDENQHHNNVSANLGVKSHYDLVHLIKREQSLDQVLVKAPDDILVLTAARGIHSLTQLSAEEQESIIKCLCELPIDVVLVYTLIKIMSQEYARQDFLVIVNKVKSEPDAQSIYENIAKVAKQHLTVRLEYLGCVLFDEKLHRASQLCRSVVDAFPASTSAIEFKQLAEKLLRCSYSNQYSGGVDNFMYRLIRTSHLNKVKLSV